MYNLSLKISGQRFSYFNEFSVTLKYNSVASVFSFSGLAISDKQRNLFKPLSFHDAVVMYGDEVLLTGNTLNNSYSSESKDSLANISGYSKTGVLSDTNIPVSLYPLQSDKLSLKEITEKILKPFDITLTVDDLVATLANKKYAKSTADHDSTIISYLIKLAAQRNIVISHTDDGKLLFTQANVSESVKAVYSDNMPSTKIGLSVNGQAMHSEITTIKQATIDNENAGEKTIYNSLIPVFRPTVKKQTSGDNDDSELAAKAIRSSELRNIVLTINTDRWTWFNGKTESIIKPNSIIEVVSPINYIKRKTKFFVESVNYKGNTKETVATIKCVLPEVYTGEQPNLIFE